jgi:hypothetical protein
MQDFSDLEPYGDNRQLHMIVETPRGSNIKFEYEPKLRAFTVSRASARRAVQITSTAPGPRIGGVGEEAKEEASDHLPRRCIRRGIVVMAGRHPILDLLDLQDRGSRLRPGNSIFRYQGSSAKIWVRQLVPAGGGATTPENWLVPQTTPRPAMTGFGSGVAAE